MYLKALKKSMNMPCTCTVHVHVERVLVHLVLRDVDELLPAVELRHGRQPHVVGDVERVLSPVVAVAQLLGEGGEVWLPHLEEDGEYRYLAEEDAELQPRKLQDREVGPDNVRRHGVRLDEHASEDLVALGATASTAGPVLVLSILSIPPSMASISGNMSPPASSATPVRTVLLGTSCPSRVLVFFGLFLGGSRTSLLPCGCLRASLRGVLPGVVGVLRSC